LLFELPIRVLSGLSFGFFFYGTKGEFFAGDDHDHAIDSTQGWDSGNTDIEEKSISQT
jgi:hypothetical protein